MPKVTLTKQEEIGRRIVNNIRAIGDLRGCRTDRRIAERVHIPESTLNDKMNNPHKFRLKDFVQISEAFHVPLTKFFEEGLLT